MTTAVNLGPKELDLLCHALSFIVDENEDFMPEQQADFQALLDKLSPLAPSVIFEDED